MKLRGSHGHDCPKVQHLGDGYLHSPDYDGPYDVDGVMYCGRCHAWMGVEVMVEESKLPGNPPGTYWDQFDPMMNPKRRR